jgi:hypothetical protein
VETANVAGHAITVTSGEVHTMRAVIQVV